MTFEFECKRSLGFRQPLRVIRLCIGNKIFLIPKLKGPIVYYVLGAGGGGGGAVVFEGGNFFKRALFGVVIFYLVRKVRGVLF